MGGSGDGDGVVDYKFCGLLGSAVGDVGGRRAVRSMEDVWSMFMSLLRAFSESVTYLLPKDQKFPKFRAPLANLMKSTHE